MSNSDELKGVALERQHWRVGVRVTRDGGNLSGTIVEADGEIKVKWDNGRTSYYKRNLPANIRLEAKADR